MKFADRRRGHSSAEHSMPTLQKAERTQGRDHSRGREHSLFRRYAADRNRSTSRIRWTVNAKLRASDISIDQPHYDVQTPTSPTEPSHTVYVRPKIPQEKNVTVIEVNSKWKYGPNEGNSQDNVDSPVLERTETTDVSVSEGLPTEEPSAAAAPPTYSRVQPRRQNWPFGVNVRGQNPEVLMLAATKILADMNITYDYVTPYRLICTQQPPASTGSYGANNKKQQPVKWETEVVQLTRAKQYGVRMKYASGDTTKYRMLEKTIMNQFPKAT
ncbi:unnamed protein product [Calicophoron daubneyi]|uniref:non-specific serine/threonine protein kinase n=1 Tax=Calicophoron daubneyi TaxID=300641 RepID=A0AAV2TEG7_CALDB